MKLGNDVMDSAQSKPVLAWPLLEDKTRVMVRQGHAEAFHPEEARLGAIDGCSLRWLWTARYVRSAGGRGRACKRRARATTSGLWQWLITPPVHGTVVLH
jgi:hypothetical protein